jgi:hypothetical protein
METILHSRLVTSAATDPVRVFRGQALGGFVKIGEIRVKPRNTRIFTDNFDRW